MKQVSEKKPVSPWSYKPWWCQPWSILLTGITLISGSWLLFKTLWVTIIVSIPLLIWMGFFLLVWPKLMIQSGVLESEQNQFKGSGTDNQSKKYLLNFSWFIDYLATM
jgi:hypothetical protein